MMPDIKRIRVKLLASIACWPKARRQSTELPAKAMSAKAVYTLLTINLWVA